MFHRLGFQTPSQVSIQAHEPTVFAKGDGWSIIPTSGLNEI